MSMWQFFSALAGHIKANSPDAGNKLSDADKDWLWDGDWLSGGAATPATGRFLSYWWDGERLNRAVKSI